MRIKELTLYTNNLKKQFEFFSNTLDFENITKDEQSFTINIGWTALTFEASENTLKYHYCFLIPKNMLEEALIWLEDRLDVIDAPPGGKTQHFESWNADSLYFYDADGNIAEFIVRHKLNNESQDSFSAKSVLCVNEIGMPTTNIAALETKISNNLNTNSWKGNQTSFSAHGDEEGLLLIVNPEKKDFWFPVQMPIDMAPCKGVFSNEGIVKKINFNSGNVHISSL